MRPGIPVNGHPQPSRNAPRFNEAQAMRPGILIEGGTKINLELALQ